ncbi:MAG: methyl-accepting chemotaxis protein [Lachnospiraceae bacterium]
MKLRTKIVLLAVIPLVIFGFIQYLFASNQLDSGVTQQAYNGMQASGMLITELIGAESDGDYQVKDDQLYKGEELNLSEQNELVDSIKKQSGYDVTVFYGDTRYLTTIEDEDGKRKIGTTASAEITEHVLKKGESYKSTNTDILGKRYVSYYLPLYQPSTNEIVGMVFLGKEYDELHEIVHKAKLSMGIGEFIMIILTVVVVYLIAKRIVDAISKGIEYVTNMGEGKLEFTMDARILARKDAVGDMCRSINELDRRLLAIIGGVKEQSNVLGKTSEDSSRAAKEALASVEQIDKTVRNIAEGSCEQAENAHETGENVVSMGNMIKDTKRNVETLANSTDSTAAASKQAKTILSELNENMAKVMEATEQVAAQTNQTHISVEKVGSMTQVITEIASQTSLLSLNASIEAARAGEQGKGFSVVASEIQQLAEQSNRAAEDIQQILQQLQEDSNSSVETMKSVQKIIEDQKDKISETNEIFETVEQNIKYSIDGIVDIQNQTELIDKTRKQTVQAVQSVAEIAQTNAATTEETAASTDVVTEKVSQLMDTVNAVKDVAEKLEEQISIFQVK